MTFDDGLRGSHVMVVRREKVTSVTCNQPGELQVTLVTCNFLKMMATSLLLMIMNVMPSMILGLGIYVK